MLSAQTHVPTGYNIYSNTHTCIRLWVAVYLFFSTSIQQRPSTVILTVSECRWSWLFTDSFFFIISEFQWLLGKHSGVVSCYIPHDFEFRIFLLRWLPTKARMPNLLRYLTHHWCREKIHFAIMPFPKALLQSECQNLNLDYWFYFAHQ